MAPLVALAAPAAPAVVLEVLEALEGQVAPAVLAAGKNGFDATALCVCQRRSETDSPDL